VEEKHLYKVRVLNFVPFGGRAIEYYRYAYSMEQVMRIVAEQFNKDYGFVRNNYVRMRIIETEFEKAVNKRT